MNDARYLCMAYRVAAAGASVNLRVTASVPKEAADGSGDVSYHTDSETISAWSVALRPDGKWHWMCMDLKAAMEYAWWAPTNLSPPADNVAHDSKVTKIEIQKMAATSKIWIDEVVFAKAPVTLTQVHAPLSLGPAISRELFAQLSVHTAEETKQSVVDGASVTRRRWPPEMPRTRSEPIGVRST